MGSYFTKDAKAIEFLLKIRDTAIDKYVNQSLEVVYVTRQYIFSFSLIAQHSYTQEFPLRYQDNTLNPEFGIIGGFVGSDLYSIFYSDQNLRNRVEHVENYTEFYGDAINVPLNTKEQAEA